ncbi:hypothetical protein P4S72_26430 [Vibrio sp. PP-XX7]
MHWHKEGPVYIRLDGKALPELYPEDYQFQPGAIDVRWKGGDICISQYGIDSS